MIRRMTRSTLLACLLGAGLVFTSSAYAQMSVGRPPDESSGITTDIVSTPRLESPGKQNMIIALGVTVIAVALCVGVVVLPGRRNYED